MKRYYSVLAIGARSSIYKIIGILLAMVALQAGLFYLLAAQTPAKAPLSPEGMILQSHIPWVSAAAFAAVCGVLCLAGSEVSHSRVRYTIRRLSVRERETVLLWAGYNTMCFLLFWAVQALILLLLCKWYLGGLDPAYHSRQSLFLACYRSAFLHSLIPMEEVSRLVRNLLLAAALGLLTARFSFLQRRDKKSIGIFVLAAITILFFSQPMGSGTEDFFMGFLAASAIVFGISSIWEDGPDET